ncbi:MAG: alpha/beta fold hydrolase [Peptococcaceae bacterium]|nr:alpha/beta fold hydrolase [Peptococcaceae bacterium]
MLRTREKVLASIPCFEIAEPGLTPKAEIILYHGWGSHAVKQCFRGHLLASFGYRVIVPEIAGHGVRGTLNYETASSVADFLQVLVQSIKECVQLAREALTPGRSHFLVGHSLGGMIVLGAVGQLHECLNGIVAMNSSANWADPLALMQGVYGEQSDLASILATEKVQMTLEALNAFDPAYWQENQVEVPVLLTNGALDHTLPAVFNTAFCERYQNEHVKQMVFPDAGHVVTDGMLSEVVNFIEEHR